MNKQRLYPTSIHRSGAYAGGHKGSSYIMWPSRRTLMPHKGRAMGDIYTDLVYGCLFILRGYIATEGLYTNLR